MTTTLNELATQTDSPDFENGQLRADLVEYYRQNGFVRVRGVLSEEEALEFREASIAAAGGGQMKDISAGSSIFTQVVNTWREDETLRRLALHPKIAALATQLAGVPLRLWHDQILIKQPHNAATEFHQDQPYWPHNNSTNPISAWVALGDVPVERGCMTFIPGSQSRTDLRMQILNIKGNMFEIAPDLVYEERIAVPLRAGDLTFHHGRCAHMANPNETDVARVAHTIIYMDESTTYNAAGHVVTGPLDLEKGTTLSGEMFPHTDEFADLING